MTAEIEARRDRHARGVEHVAAERLAVGGEARAVGVHEESSARRHRNAESQLAQRRHEEIAAVAEGASPLFEQRQGAGQEAGERRALRYGRRTDVEILRELLEIADVALRRDDPPQPPPGHVEVLGEARHDEDVVGVLAGDGQRGLRLAVVGQAEIDLVDDEPPAQARAGRGDPAQLVRRNLRAGRVRRRRDQHAARARRPRRFDQIGGKLVIRLRPDRNADGFPLEHADEMPVARIAGIGQQDLVVAIDEERHDQQQRGGRTGGHDHAFGGDGDAEALGIVPRNRLPQLRNAQRRRVVDAAVGQRRLRGGERPAPASENRARRFPCAPRCGRPPRAPARPSAPP